MKLLDNMKSIKNAFKSKTQNLKNKTSQKKAQSPDQSLAKNLVQHSLQQTQNQSLLAILCGGDFYRK